MGPCISVNRRSGLTWYHEFALSRDAQVFDQTTQLIGRWIVQLLLVRKLSDPTYRKKRIVIGDYSKEANKNEKSSPKVLFGKLSLIAQLKKMRSHSNLDR